MFFNTMMAPFRAMATPNLYTKTQQPQNAKTAPNWSQSNRLDWDNGQMANPQIQAQMAQAAAMRQNSDWRQKMQSKNVGAPDIDSLPSKEQRIAQAQFTDRLAPMTARSSNPGLLNAMTYLIGKGLAERNRK